MGIFDVSHMGRLIVRGADSCTFLDSLTTNNVSSLGVADGQYSLLCNEKGGIKDDLLVFRLAEAEYLLVYNAANRSKDYEWLLKHLQGAVQLTDVSDEVAMYALQGPDAARVLQQVVNVDLKTVSRFGSAWSRIADSAVLMTRTGYTGEDGFEIFVMNSQVDHPEAAVKAWEKLLEAGKPHGIEPCGLGARDLLRLEAGFCLYGTDMDESTNPYEAKLGFVVKLEKEFVGRLSLKEVKEGGTIKSRTCFVTSNRVIPRHGYAILRTSGQEVGQVTSGTLSPILDKGIAMGYVGTEDAKLSSLGVRVRDRVETVTSVKPPFYDTTKYGYARKQQ